MRECRLLPSACCCAEVLFRERKFLPERTCSWVRACCVVMWERTCGARRVLMCKGRTSCDVCDMSRCLGIRESAV